MLEIDVNPRHLLLVPLVLAACAPSRSEYALGARPEPEPPVDTRPEIRVTPQDLDFGVLSIGAQAVLPLRVENVGDADLALDGITVEGASFTVLTSVDGQVLGPGAELDVDVAFTALAGGGVSGLAHVWSSDPETPDVPVELTGQGAIPELTITPTHHDFGTASIPCGDTVTITLESTGDDVLVVDGLDYAGSGQLSLVDANTWPMTLEPGETATVDVVFAATTAAAEIGVLTAHSNDPRGDLTAEQSAEGSWVGQQTDVFDVVSDPPVDILFAIDQSCSMDQEAAVLGDAFSSFIATIDEVTTDWQIGVVTHEDGCFNSGVLTASTPGYEALFQAAVVDGEHHALTEALLELSYTALSNGLGGVCNVGFPRPGAMLHVVLVTDEPDNSNQLWGIWTLGMQSMVSSPSLLKISGVLDVNHVCGRGAVGYLDAVAFTGGVQLDVCDAAWGDQVEDLAIATLPPTSEFALSGAADAGSIAVTVGGLPQATGWSYDAVKNAVVFDDGFDGGEHVEVTYNLLAECP